MIKLPPDQAARFEVMKRILQTLPPKVNIKKLTPGVARQRIDSEYLVSKPPKD